MVGTSNQSDPVAWPVTSWNRHETMHHKSSCVSQQPLCHWLRCDNSHRATSDRRTHLLSICPMERPNISWAFRGHSGIPWYIPFSEPCILPSKQKLVFELSKWIGAWTTHIQMTRGRPKNTSGWWICMIQRNLGSTLTNLTCSLLDPSD